MDKYICQAFTPAIINIGLYCEVVGFEAFVTKQTVRIIFHTTATGENGVEKLKTTYQFFQKENFTIANLSKRNASPQFTIKERIIILPHLNFSYR